MTKKRRLTVADRLLISALELDRGTRETFTAEELVVAAWSRFPDAFGLRGITDEVGRSLHPDSNRVFAEIMGSKPLRKDGYVEKVGDKRYQLTEAGRRKARYLTGEEAEASPRRGLDRQLQDDVRRLARSRANEKFLTDGPNHLTFTDACGFWGISPRSSAMELEAKRAHVAAVISIAMEMTQEGSIYLDRSGGTEMSLEGAEQLAALDAIMAQKFQQELDVIRSRTDER